MEDFIFGTVATDELKLLNHRAAYTGIQHLNRISPAVPVGDAAVLLTVTVGPGLRLDAMAAYYTTDGSVPLGSRGVAARGAAVRFSPHGVSWSTLLWGYVQEWRAEVPMQPQGALVKYRISGWDEHGMEIFADYPESKLMIEQATDAWFKGQTFTSPGEGAPPAGKVFSYRVGKHVAPQWAHEAVIYQIFVDRFNPGQGRTWNSTKSLGERQGGTLWGVLEQLDYIEQLGANAVWLSPTWPSPTHHGYDVLDYERTHPELGGDAAMRALIGEAHRRGIKVILDLVCNHISNEHPYFLDAHSNRSSPYRDWFIFDESAVGYRSFFGTMHMPQLNLENTGAREWMFNVARYWLQEFDVDGYRLDHANGPSPDFWPEFTAACQAAKSDAFVFGEVVEPPDLQAAYRGRLHGLLDFHLCDHLRKTFGYQTLSAAELEAFLERHRKYIANDPEFILLTFLDNHDMDRFGYICNGQSENIRRAATIQFAQPGTPIIYYGTEIGLGQAHSIRETHMFDVSREPMVWDPNLQNRELLDFYQELIAARCRG